MDTWKSPRARNNKSALELLGIKTNKNASEPQPKTSPSQQQKKKVVPNGTARKEENEQQKGRGRPRKTTVNIAQVPENLANTTGNPKAATPRGRGRPRKVGSSLLGNSNDSSKHDTAVENRNRVQGKPLENYGESVKIPARGRGRPGKTSVESAVNTTEANNDALKDCYELVSSVKGAAETSNSGGIAAGLKQRGQMQNKSRKTKDGTKGYTTASTKAAPQNSEKEKDGKKEATSASASSEQLEKDDNNCSGEGGAASGGPSPSYGRKDSRFGKVSQKRKRDYGDSVEPEEKSKKQKTAESGSEEEMGERKEDMVCLGEIVFCEQEDIVKEVEPQPPISITPTASHRPSNRRRKIPQKYRNFDVEDVSTYTSVITVSPNKANKKTSAKIAKEADDDALDVWKIMQIKREEGERQPDELSREQFLEVFEEMAEDLTAEPEENPQEAGRVEIIPGGATEEMSQEDAVNLLMDVANTSRQRQASCDLEGITLSLKEVPSAQVEICVEDQGASFHRNEGLPNEGGYDEDNELSYAACEVLSKVAEDVILDSSEHTGSKVIVVEGVETRQGQGVRQGTLLTWRVQNLDENQQNLSAEELQESMANAENSSGTYKVEVTGPEAYEVNRRAKPGRYVILSAEHEDLMNKLEPDDDITNHVRIVPKLNHSMTLCKYCDTVILNRHHFRQHIKQHKETVLYKPWKCPLCDYRANIKAQIGRHINIHGAMKPFICNACGRGFNFRQKLLQHMKYHLDIRDRECPICGLAFHEFKILKHHLQKIHHITSGFETLKKNGSGIENDAELQMFWQKKMEEVAKQQNNASENEIVNVNTPDDEVVEDNENTGEEESEEQDEQPDTSHNDLSCQEETVEGKEDADAETVIMCLTGGKKVPLEMKGGKVVVPRMLVKSHLLNRRQGTLKTSRTIISTENFRRGVKPPKKSRPGQLRKVPRMYSRRLTHMESLFEEYCTIVPSSGVEVSSYYKCKLCTETAIMFKNKTHFLQHMEKDHPTVKPWRCTLCNFSSRLRSGLISHEKLHNPDFSQDCDTCGRTFRDKRKFIAHQRHHQNLREHGCTMCDRRFNERSDMLKHIRRVHATVFPYKCLRCERAFSERAQLKRHMDQHIGGKQQCGVCHKFYRSQTSLHQHMKSHTCMFHCEICNKSFSSYSGFMAHKVMHDESYQGYKCSVCPQVLLTKGSLKRHLEVVHSKKRDWVCTAENCKKSYKSKKDLMNHMLSHSATMHTCLRCDFKCKRPESMKIHMLRHQNSKPFKCHLCSKEYTQKQTLEIHLRHHTGQMEGRCELCGREFLTKYGLMLHMKRRHIVKEPAELPAGSQKENNPTLFVCEECQAVFASQDKLAIHILAEHMQQDWSTVSTVSTSPSVAVEVEVDGSSAETNMNASADGNNSVLVVPENANFKSQSSLQDTVSVADVALNSGRKYVSLLRNNINKPAEQVVSQAETQILQSEENVTVQHVLFDNSQSQKNVATLINPDTNEETLVTISDPQLSQELFVSMPTSNFENLLPASSIAGNPDLTSGQFQETYITINQDGEVISNPQPMIGEIVTTVLDLDTEIAPEMIEEQFVTETVEIPLSIEDGVTTDLTQGAEESQVITYDNLSTSPDGTYVIIQQSNPCQVAENL